MQKSPHSLDTMGIRSSGDMRFHRRLRDTNGSSCQRSPTKNSQSKSRVLTSLRRLMGGPPRKAEPAGSARTPEELTADYLTALIKHLRYILGQKLGAAVLRTVPLEFVLTVPAGWTERAKGKTVAACQKAGLDTKTALSLVSEPVSDLISNLTVIDEKVRKLLPCILSKVSIRTDWRLGTPLCCATPEVELSI